MLCFVLWRLLWHLCFYSCLFFIFFFECYVVCCCTITLHSLKCSTVECFTVEKNRTCTTALRSTLPPCCVESQIVLTTQPKQSSASASNAVATPPRTRQPIPCKETGAYSRSQMRVGGWGGEREETRTEKGLSFKFAPIMLLLFGFPNFPRLCYISSRLLWANY